MLQCDGASIMEYINEIYDKGYFKALLDVRNEIEFLTNNMTKLKSKKKYAKLIQSMMKLLTENSELRDNFRVYGGFKYWNFNNLVINPNTGEISQKKGNKRC